MRASSATAVEQRLALGLRPRGDAARGRGPVDEPRRRERHRVREAPPTVGRERRVPLDLLEAQLAGSRDDVGGPVEQPIEVGDPGHRPVAQVPDEPEHAARAQDARDLGARRPRLEPVERLRDEHRVGARIGERDRLGRARQRLDVREPGPERGAHLVVGLDRDDRRAALDDRLGQLPGSGREIDHLAAGRGLEEPLDRGRRVARAGRVRSGRRRRRRSGLGGRDPPRAFTLPSGPPPSGTIRRMQPTEKIWRNGSFVPWDEANVHILTHALHYGTGVFEGIRAYDTPRGTAVFRLTDHLQRFRRSAALYEMDLGYSVPRAGRGDPRDRRREQRGVVLRPADRVPRGRAHGALPARQPGRDRGRRLAVGRVPGRGGAGARRQLQGVELPPDRPEHAAADRQGVGPVHQLGAREARGEPGRRRRGDPAERGGLRRRRLGRERLRRS